MRRKLGEKSVRKIYKHGGSYAITLPIEVMGALGWRNKQKIIVKKRGKGIVVADWKK